MEYPHLRIVYARLASQAQKMCVGVIFDALPDYEKFFENSKILLFWESRLTPNIMG